MITMLHYDAVRNPLPPEVATLTQSGPKKQPILTEAQHLGYLQAHPYQQFTEEEIENVILKNNNFLRKGVFNYLKIKDFQYSLIHNKNCTEWLPLFIANIQMTSTVFSTV